MNEEGSLYYEQKSPVTSSLAPHVPSVKPPYYSILADSLQVVHPGQWSGWSAAPRTSVSFLEGR
jgi:hypothetical protein